MVWSVVFCTAPRARAEISINTSYEFATIQKELDRRGWEVDPSPEGKSVSEIEIVTLDVFDETDPVPDFLNVFHVITRKRVIARELLFGVGRPWVQRRIDETTRNLRAMIQLSLVLIVPVVDPDPGRVRVLVITKDVWSLRLNSNLQYGAEGLTYLLLNPTEWNWFGTHANLGGLFILRRSTYSTGLLLSDTRLLGTRLSAAASASLIWNRDTGKSEGSTGTFDYGSPRYSESQRWLFWSSLSWDDGITRVSMLRRADHTRVLLSYDRERYVAINSVTRSFGLRRKLDFSFGTEIDRRMYRSRAGANVDPETRASFERNEIPVSDTRLSPFVQLRGYRNQFMKTIELETLGLQEDFRLGPEVLLKLYPASTHLGSSRDLLGIVSGVAYTARLRDGLLRAVASTSLELSRSRQHQAKYTANLRIATPRLGFGRVIFDSMLETRGQNYLSGRSALGGDGRLRGYPAADTEAAGSTALRGSSIAVTNTEFRSSSIDILSAQCGIAAFYDAGGAAPSLVGLKLKSSVGIGLRILFPQADRVVLRADWAWPLGAEQQSWPGAAFVTFGQAFAMPELGG